jgi:hypothetical protein
LSPLPRRASRNSLDNARRSTGRLPAAIAAHQHGRPQEIEALLRHSPTSVPRSSATGPAELADLLDRFRRQRHLRQAKPLARARGHVTAELVPAPETSRPPRRRSQNSDIAGFEPATSGL